MATGLVVGIPVALTWLLIETGTVTGSAPLVMIAVGTSLLGFQAGAALWKRHSGAGDLLFGELMLWGWLRRLWTEWRLDRAASTILPAVGAEGTGREERAEQLRTLSAALEASDPYTHGHSRRVARYSATIARALDLDADEVARVHTAAAVHDVGKIKTPPSVLRKPGGLTDEEYEVIKRHAADGAEMVSVLEDAALTESVRHHHERLDGSGYPAGLAGEQIPLGARIIAVADTFDAIASTRPYRRGRTHREALAVLSGEAGAHLDPKAVQAFVGHYSDSRPAALWTVLATIPERITAAFGGALNAGSSALAGIAVAVTATAGAAGAAPPATADALPRAAFICAVRALPEHEASGRPVASSESPARDRSDERARPAAGSGPAAAPAPTLTSVPVDPATGGSVPSAESVAPGAATPAPGAAPPDQPDPPVPPADPAGSDPDPTVPSEPPPETPSCSGVVHVSDVAPDLPDLPEVPPVLCN